MYTQKKTLALAQKFMRAERPLACAVETIRHGVMYAVCDGFSTMLTDLPLEGIEYHSMMENVSQHFSDLLNVFLNDGVDLYHVHYKALCNLIKYGKCKTVCLATHSGPIFVNSQFLKTMFEYGSPFREHFVRIEFTTEGFKGGCYIKMLATDNRKFYTLPVNVKPELRKCVPVLNDPWNHDYQNWADVDYWTKKEL